MSWPYRDCFPARCESTVNILPKKYRKMMLDALDKAFETGQEKIRQEMRDVLQVPDRKDVGL